MKTICIFKRLFVCQNVMIWKWEIRVWKADILICVIVQRTSFGNGKQETDERYYRAESIKHVGINLQQTLHLFQGPTAEMKNRLCLNEEKQMIRVSREKKIYREFLCQYLSNKLRKNLYLNRPKSKKQPRKGLHLITSLCLMIHADGMSGLNRIGV